ncbi:MAG: hypothetical protein RIR00_2244 [Pseudomonadota bacterium]|jgi:phospholipase C
MGITPNARAHIKHVVVLMMENRSFDHLLGNFKKIDPNCEGVVAADRLNRANRVIQLDRNFYQEADAPDNLALQLLAPEPNPDKKVAAFDPMHEFSNCVTQLGGDWNKPTMYGFAQDAYYHYHDKEGFKDHIAPLIQRVMNYVPFGDTPATDPLPGLQGLARAFTVCDHWFCSLPGPTFANRFFAMKGSCYGKVLMPGDWKDATLGLADYITQVGKDSIFSLTNESGRKAQIYSQGPTPFAFMAKDGGNRKPMSDFFADCHNGSLPELSWLEPDYSYDGTDGCSQHPPEDLRYGDAFIAQIYNALRANDKQWQETLFVVYYDEHGGFYDHVCPPNTIAPDDYIADVDFDFSRLGPRVPAVLISPWIKRQIDKTTYDHTSLLAFICELFGLDKARLGKRTAHAAHFGQAPIWLDTPRQDTPQQLRLAPQPERLIQEKQHETGLAAQIGGLIDALNDVLPKDKAIKINANTTRNQVLQHLRPLGRALGRLSPPAKLTNLITTVLHRL